MDSFYIIEWLEHGFWTGTGWNTRRTRAKLFPDLDSADGELVRIPVRGTQQISIRLVDLGEWLR